MQVQQNWMLQDRFMKMIENQEDLPKMKDAADVADRLSNHLMIFINKWLESEADAVVVVDDPEEEPMVVAGGNKNGHGHISLNFYFKEKR